MELLNPTIATIAARLAIGDIEHARAALRSASHVEWVSDQAAVYLRELWETVNATHALEQAVREASQAAQPLLAPEGGLA